jgi:hypothetical protein
MPTSIFHAMGALGIALVTTAAVPTCGTHDGSSAESPGVMSTTTPPTLGPGLPADFPLAPGLTACKPELTGPEILCEWHGVDGHAVYAFYHDALPKAGYALLPGAQEVSAPHYLGAMGFTKGSAKGAVTIAGSDLTIQILTRD